MAPASQDLVLRPRPAYRAGGCAAIICGVVFGPAGLTDRGQPDFSWTQTVWLGLSGLFIAYVGVSMFSARAVVSPDGIRSRFGPVRRFIPAASIEAVVAGPGSRQVLKRVCLNVRRNDRDHPERLTVLQRLDTSSGRAAVERDAAKVSAVLGL